MKKKTKPVPSFKVLSRECMKARGKAVRQFGKHARASLDRLLDDYFRAIPEAQKVSFALSDIFSTVEFRVTDGTHLLFNGDEWHRPVPDRTKVITKDVQELINYAYAILYDVFGDVDFVKRRDQPLKDELL